jgi:undecaprenyl-diphosphatase
MIEWLELLDQRFVLAVNGMHTPLLDECMWIVSGKLTWIPLYLFLIGLVVRHYSWKTSFYFLGVGILMVGLTDLTCTYGFKEVFQRYRPSHHTELSKILHFYTMKPGEFYKGGMYGFVSSHAANFTCLASLTWLFVRMKTAWIGSLLLFCGLLIAWSRMYLGVHYLTDIIGGVFVGLVYGLAGYRLLMYLSSKKKFAV